MKKVTAKKFLREFKDADFQMRSSGIDEKTANKAMIEFTKLHLERFYDSPLRLLEYIEQKLK